MLITDAKRALRLWINTIHLLDKENEIITQTPEPKTYMVWWCAFVHGGTKDQSVLCSKECTTHRSHPSYCLSAQWPQALCLYKRPSSVTLRLWISTKHLTTRANMEHWLMVGVAFYKGLISYETDHLFRLSIMIPDSWLCFGGNIVHIGWQSMTWYSTD